MTCSVVVLVIAHLIGDFMFQTTNMADRKYLAGWLGTLWCTLHVTIYTAGLAFALQSMSPYLLLGIFVPHWLIDRYSLSYHWMQLIGRAALLSHKHPTKAAFGAIIYVVTDQTLHLVSLTVLFTFLKL